MHVHRPLVALAAVGLLAGTAACQAPLDQIRTRPFAPTFRMYAGAGAAEGRAAVVVAPAGAIAAALEGELTVRFEHLLGDRRLMATVADVKSLTITLAGNGVNHTETITAAMLAAGMTSFTFTGLPAGVLTVSIRALDAAGATIGTDVRQATVTAGQTTVVASTVLIAPSVTQPRIIVNGGSGGSGGASTGSLTTTITLQDGTPVVTPTLHATYTTTGYPHAARVEFDNAGNTWFVGGTAWIKNLDDDGTPDTVLRRITPAGAVTTLAHGTSMPYDLAARPDGGLIVTTCSEYGLIGSGTKSGVGFLPDGTEAPGFADTRTPDTLLMNGALSVAADGRTFWAVTAHAGMVFGGSGYQGVIWPDEGTTNWWTPPISSAATTSGEFVVGRRVLPGSAATDGPVHVSRIRRDGTFAWTYALPDQGEEVAFLALDAQDNVWLPVPSQQALIKLSPAGALLATYPMPVRCNAVHIDATGRIWAYQAKPHAEFYLSTAPNDAGAPDDLVMRVGTDGRVQAFYHLGLGVDVFDLKVTADDHMWVASGTKGLLHLELP